MEGLVQTTSRMLRLRLAAKAAALSSISPERICAGVSIEHWLDYNRRYDSSVPEYIEREFR